jgi:SAM-dependent methyltransferase
MATDSSRLFVPLETCPLCDCEGYNVIRHEPVNIEGFTQEDRRFLMPYNQALIEFRKCLKCTFCYLDRLPKDKAYYELIYGRIKYDWDYEFKYNGKKNIFRDITRHLRRYKPSGSLLDIGTWCGTLLEALKDVYDVSGCELGVEASAYGRSVGLNIKTGDFNDIEYEFPFDIVTMIDVLEHMTEPRKVIQQVRGLLKPDGLLYLKVPNGPAQIWKENLLTRLGFKTAGASFGYVHINHFGRISLRMMLESAGFEVVEAGHAQLENHDLSFPDSFNNTARKWLSNKAANSAVRLTAVLYSLRIADVTPHLFVIAKKTQSD